MLSHFLHDAGAVGSSQAAGHSFRLFRRASDILFSTMESWIVSLTSVSVGFALGFAGDRIKRWLDRRDEIKLAKKEIYDELASYVLDWERVKSPEGTQAEYARLRTIRPEFTAFDWYKKNRLDLLLRLDKNKAIRTIDEHLSQFEKSNRREPFGPELVSMIHGPDSGLDDAYLQERLAIARQRHAKPGS
jgi:hypothetical protein